MMVRRLSGQTLAVYRFHVAAHLDQHWSPSFGTLTFRHEEDGTTTIIGPVTDQAELHGLLARIRDLGVTLISVAVIDPPQGLDTDPVTPGMPRDVQPTQPEATDVEPRDVPLPSADRA